VLARLLGFALLLLVRPTPRSLLLAAPLAVLGEGLRIWACGHIEKRRVLATGGPYAYTRNPLYVGNLFLVAGAVVASASPWVALVAVLYVAAFFPRNLKEEARFLAGKFGDDYAAWAAEVPLFLPRLTPAGPRASSFSWSRVFANREWEAALIVPGTVALLLGVYWLREFIAS
jgi:protein-S-isoprenylcysteine O-methyltransferase Ste14